MALKKTLTIDNTEYPNAYHKIVDVVLNHEPAANLRVNTWASMADSKVLGTILTTRSYVQPTYDKSDDSQSAHSQWYTYLKTEVDFDGAADVLE